MLGNPTVSSLVLRKVGGTLHDSVFNQILWAIDMLGLSSLFKSTVSPLEITYIPTGQKIYFRGADDPIKIKSIKPKKGYMGIVWFEEASQFFGEEEIRSILQSTNRGGNQYWNFYTYNPPKSRDSWVNMAIEEKSVDKLTAHNTYLDVPIEWLGEQFFFEAEKLKARKPEAYEHEYLGIATGTGGDVFDNVIGREVPQEEIDTIGAFRQGIDHGFAIDPFVWLKMAYCPKRNTLWILDEIYQVRLSNKSAVEKVKEKQGNRKEMIIADSAEPRTNAEFNNLGLYIIPAKKGPDSIERGIKWLQDLDAIIIDTNKAPNAFKEFSKYQYDMDKNGTYISNYPDKNNHTIDAARYGMEDIINERKVRWL